MDSDFITAAEAGTLLNLPTGTVRRMVDAGDFPGTWDATSGECCIPRAAVLRFKKQLSTKPMQDANNPAGNVAGSNNRSQKPQH